MCWSRDSGADIGWEYSQLRQRVPYTMFFFGFGLRLRRFALGSRLAHFLLSVLDYGVLTLASRLQQFLSVGFWILVLDCGVLTSSSRIRLFNSWFLLTSFWLWILDNNVLALVSRLRRSGSVLDYAVLTLGYRLLCSDSQFYRLRSGDSRYNAPRFFYLFLYLYSP